jgi:exonuclease III
MTVLRMWSWNLGGAFRLRQDVIDATAAADVDLILAQEVRPSVATAGGWTTIPDAAVTWGMTQGRRYQSAILHRGTLNIAPEPETVPLTDFRWDKFCLSTPGTCAAATLRPDTAEPIILISVYCPWDGPASAWQRGSGLLVSEANAHRVVSDISMLAAVMDHPDSHRIIIAGDWNILYGYGELGSTYWAKRYSSVFARMEALGFTFCGPQAPAGGRQADPWPDELPAGSRCVPTFYHSRSTPAAATRQMDFVFASESLARQVRVEALNDPASWGPSDHCRILIEIQLP